MDANKREQLVAIGYKIHPACGLCHHGDFAPSTDWGVCRLHTYSHQKHSESRRSLSVHQCGGCPQFKMSAAAEFALHAFTEFKEGVPL